MTDKYSNSFQVCPDDHKCENGSLCAENPVAEGKYYCDCDEIADLNNAFSGLSCQHRATVFCTLTGEISRTTFCTNEGTCRALVDTKETHMGCDCPTGYEGSHCQFVAGTQPKGWPTAGGVGTRAGAAANGGSLKGANNQVIGGGMSASWVTVIVLVAVVVGVLVIVFVSRRRQIAITHVIDRGNSKSTDGHVHNADGGEINQVRKTTTPTFDSDAYMQDGYENTVEFEGAGAPPPNNPYAENARNDNAYSDAQDSNSDASLQMSENMYIT